MALGQYELFLIPKSGGLGGRRKAIKNLDPKDDQQLRQALIDLLPEGHKISDYRIEARQKTGRKVGEWHG